MRARGARAAPAQRLGVLVPARDEAATIAAKLADLAAAAWPAAPPGRPHLVLVVDDHSSDDTRARAAAALEALRARGVAARVLAAGGAPGKPGAIRTGLAALAAEGFEGEHDLVVLTDADVALERGALAALSEAFAREPRLGMASGAQRYVAGDPFATVAGEAAGEAGEVGAGAGGAPCDMRPYDRAFARARALESRCGALLSVHGQLLAWRAALALAPPDGRAADDLELVVAARDRPRPPRVRLVAGARFVERRAAPGPAAEAQAIRRARAWFQHFAGPAPRRRALRLQWRLWGLAPRVLGALARPLAPLAPSLAARRRVLRAARRAEAVAPLPARWDVARG